MANNPSSVINGKSKDDESLVICFGEMLIDFVPTVAGVSLAEAPAFAKAAGGAPANVAVGISRLGGSSAFVGKVGKDEFGIMLADILKQNKVDNSGMRFDPGARTALAFVTLRADGEREFLFFRNPSADILLHESELDKDQLQKARIFHYGSISLIEEPCKSAHLAAMKTVSEDEITFLTGGDDPFDDNVVMKKLFHPNLKLLIVTEGSEGCRYYTQTFKGRVGGVKVKPVDTTGAGDAFVGGFLSSLASDLNLLKDEKRLRDALYFANACGAVTVTKRGAIPSLPTRDEVLEIMQKV
ncbi:putative fructokinase-7 [Bienertia sinuspersici]